LFEVPSDEELDVSFDEFTAYPESKGSTKSDVQNINAGRISSFSSSHGSTESSHEVEDSDFSNTTTIPEETDKDIEDVTEKVSSVDIHSDKSDNCEGKRLVNS